MVTLHAEEPSWVDLVSPLITPAEKKTWLALSDPDRVKFEQDFWANKSISSEEYFKRLAHADATWGGPRQGSSGNTDPGRVYLSLGAPFRVARFPSSRIFVPLEIWYYEAPPGLVNAEVRLIFFQKNNTGFLQLYSPTNDTIRALMLNESGTRTVFGPNDIIDENEIRQNLNVPPAEDEIISAAVNVAAGIRDVGNEEIIGEALSPRLMLTRRPKTSVESRFFVDRPKLDFLLSRSPFGGAQVDMTSEVTVRGKISIEVLEGQATTVYHNVLKLNLPEARSVQYIHRLDLLPGSYRVMAGIDGQTFPYRLEVPAEPPMSDIVRASRAVSSLHAPFEFDDNRFYPDADGRYVLVTLPHPGEVQWSIRRNTAIVWRQTTSGKEAAVLALPFDKLPPGHYQLEAVADGQWKRLDFESKASNREESDPHLISFNANLSPAARQALIGHEWLIRGGIAQARANLAAAVDAAPIEQAQIDLARIDVLAEHWDAARDRVRPIVAQNPKNFEALCVYAVIEAGLEDYRVAAQLYQQALAIEDSPAVRLALTNLRQQ
jgi:GWxTD domain-containing protein